MRSKASLQRPSDTVREFGSNVASETPRQRPPPALPRVEQPCLNTCKSKTDPPSSHFQNPVRLFQTARHTERPSSHCEKDRRPDIIPTTPRDSLRRQKPASPTDFVHFSSHRKTPSTTASRPHVAGPTAPPHHRPYRPHRRSAPPSVARPSAAPVLKKHPRDRPATFLLSPTPPPTLLPDTAQRNPAYLPGVAPKIRSYRPLRCNLETRAAIRGGRSCVPSDAPQSKSRKTVLQSTVPPLHRNTPAADPTTPSYRNQSAGK